MPDTSVKKAKEAKQKKNSHLSFYVGSLFEIKISELSL